MKLLVNFLVTLFVFLLGQLASAQIVSVNTGVNSYIQIGNGFWELFNYERGDLTKRAW
jgi:hypothetical protein